MNLAGYDVSWDYAHTTDEDGPYVITNCNIICPDGEAWIGTAVQNPEDRFVKETGRKISLTRALLGITDKNVRAQIWKAYFARK